MVALVTGGTRGIGLGIAKELAKLGFDLALNGIRSENDVQTVLEELRAAGTKVIYCQGNVADATARTAMLDQIKNTFGQLNILVNNAGIAPRVRLDLLETTEESYEHVMDTNLKANFFLTQAVAKWMIQQKSETSAYQYVIINISSISAVVASVNRGEYCLSKAGIAMSTQLFAVKLAEFGISVFEVRPGVIKTDMTAAVEAKYDALLGGGLTLQPRWGTPEDVGRAVAAIAAGSFPYSTGSIFNVDGGLTIHRL